MTDSLRLVPLRQAEAFAFIEAQHRHCKAPIGDVIRVGVERGGSVVGVGTAGRPSARMLDDGQTLEVTRVCTDGTRNACSMIYGALVRAARVRWTIDFGGNKAADDSDAREALEALTSG